MQKQAELGLNLSTWRTRKAVFLDEMELVVPWRELIALIAAASPVASTGRPPFAHETMVRIHFLQQWFGLSDLAMEEALFETPLYRGFAGLSGSERIPDRVSILRFPHRSKSTSSACRYWPPSTARWPPKGCCSRTAQPSTPR